MTLRNFLTVASIVAIAFGLGFVLVTLPLISLYNVTLNAGGVFVGQLFGAALIGFGVLNWFARMVTDSECGRLSSPIWLAMSLASSSPSWVN